jgi:hypothetical protein
MAKHKLLELLGSSLKNEDIASLLNLPGLIFVDDLEEAQELRKKYSSQRYRVIHSPEIVANYEPWTFKLGWFGENQSGILVPGHQVREAMAHLYEMSGESSQGNINETLQSLEDSIQQTSAERTQNMAALEETAKSLLSEKKEDQDNQQLMRFIHDLTTSQFEELEYFSREAIQNADGSAEDKKKNRIDIYANPEERIIRFSDQGRGMTQDVMNDVFFNIYASLNETLSHAAGKFGLGAVSFFGLGHEYVKVDSKPREGMGGVAIVDAQLNREAGFLPNEREDYGTTIEIKLAEDSEVNFERVIEILKEDCCYVETPLYLHQNDSTEQLNKSLKPPKSVNTIPFQENNLEGFLTKHSGEGSLDLLAHRIKLKSIHLPGISGAINCPELDTSFSRDTVLDDPVLKDVLQYIRVKSKEFECEDTVDIKSMSLETKLRHYQDFLQSTLFTADGSPNLPWIKDHLQDLIHMGHSPPEDFQDCLEKSYVHRILGTIVNTIISPLRTDKEFKANKHDIAGYGLAIVGVGYLGACGSAYLESVINDHSFASPMPVYTGVALAITMADFIDIAGTYAHRKIKRFAQKKLISRYNNKLSEMAFTTSLEEQVNAAGRTAKLAATGLLVGSLILGGVVGINALSEDEKPQTKKTKIEKVQKKSRKNKSKEFELYLPGEESEELPIYIPLLGASVLAAGVGTLVWRRKRKDNLMREAYTEELSEKELQVLDAVKKQFGELPFAVDTYFGASLQEEQPFYLAKGAVVLNPQRLDVVPELVALKYVSEIRKELELAKNIAESYAALKRGEER